MDTIVVPVDLSADSLKGLEFALLISRHKPSKIQMVYVQKTSEDYRPGTYEEEFHFAETQLRKLRDQYKTEVGGGSKLDFIIKKGKIYREVVEQAESHKNSMICASTHGASGFEEFFIGSNAFKIISATGNPVITLRKKPPQQVKKIMVPLKLQVDTRQKLPLSADLAEIFGAEIHLVSLSITQNKKDNQRLQAYLDQSGNYLRRRNIAFNSKKIQGENYLSMTLNYCEAVDADMLSIMTSQSGNWSVLMGSYAHKILSRSNIPVLSVTAREKSVPSGFATQGRR